MTRAVSGSVPVLLAVTMALSFVKVGTVVPNPSLPGVEGGEHALVDPQRLTVFLFFDPSQPHSREVMEEMARLQEKMAGENVRWVGVVSDRFDAAAAEALTGETGLKLELLVDRGDRLYGDLEVRLYPTLGLIDSRGVLLAYLPYRKVNFTGALEAYLRHALGQIDDEQLASALDPKAAHIGGNGAEAGRLLKFAGMLWQRGKRDAALSTARKAVEAAPGLAEAHATVGVYLAGMGDCEAARASLLEALKLDPECETARTALEECGETPGPDETSGGDG